MYRKFDVYEKIIVFLRLCVGIWCWMKTVNLPVYEKIIVFLRLCVGIWCWMKTVNLRKIWLFMKK